MDDKAIARILELPKIVAVVGLSDKPERPSFEVASYLMAAGYRIVPINPTILEWRGQRSYASLRDLPDEVADMIDVVDVFRKKEEIPSVVDDALTRWPEKSKVLWLQLGITHAAAETRAHAAGWEVVANRCMKIEHARLERLGLL